MAFRSPPLGHPPPPPFTKKYIHLPRGQIVRGNLTLKSEVAAWIGTAAGDTRSWKSISQATSRPRDVIFTKTHPQESDNRALTAHPTMITTPAASLYLSGDTSQARPNLNTARELNIKVTGTEAKFILTFS